MKKADKTAIALRAQNIYASSNDEGTEDLNDALAGTSNNSKRENKSVSMVQIPIGSNKAFINPEEYFQNFQDILSKFNLINMQVFIVYILSFVILNPNLLFSSF